MNNERIYSPRRRDSFRKSLGIEGEKEGEIVFIAAMTGYQEIMTDHPSYKGQIVAMTYPLIGNYGVNGEDVESEAQRLKVLLPVFSKIISNFRAQDDLLNYLKKHNIIALEEVDTRPYKAYTTEGK